MGRRLPTSDKLRLTLAIIVILGLLIYSAPAPVYTLTCKVTDPSIESVRIRLTSSDSEHAYVQFGTVPNVHEFRLPKDEYILSIQRRSKETEHLRLVLSDDVTVEY